MTFKEYLAKRQARDNIQGDLVRDARSDAKFPDVATWVELKGYLLRRRGSAPIEAARLVWAAYQASVKGGRSG